MYRSRSPSSYSSAGGFRSWAWQRAVDCVGNRLPSSIRWSVIDCKGRCVVPSTLPCEVGCRLGFANSAGLGSCNPGVFLTPYDLILFCPFLLSVWYVASKRSLSQRVDTLLRLRYLVTRKGSMHLHGESASRPWAGLPPRRQRIRQASNQHLDTSANPRVETRFLSDPRPSVLRTRCVVLARRKGRERLVCVRGGIRLPSARTVVRRTRSEGFSTPRRPTGVFNSQYSKIRPAPLRGKGLRSEKEVEAEPIRCPVS